MGDPTRRQRILEPGDTAIAYGLAAAANMLAKALGQAPVIPESQVEPTLNLADLVLRLMAASEKESHVVRARALWLQLTKEDPSLISVSVMDLVWWTKNVPKALPAKPAIADIGGYDAWTNSSTLVLVAPSLFDKGIQDQDLGDEVAKILLRHEAKHVDQFRKTGDRPPGSYQLMAFLESQAYAKTSTELGELANQKQAWNAVASQFATQLGEVAIGFGDDMKKSPDAEVRKAIVNRGLLPKSAPPLPAGLYVP